jgi:hypothetical protein
MLGEKLTTFVAPEQREAATKPPEKVESVTDVAGDEAEQEAA